MNAAMITMNSANMMSWLTPSMISGNASGMRTFHRICRGVHPDVVAASMMWWGTDRSPIVV